MTFFEVFHPSDSRGWAQRLKPYKPCNSNRGIAAIREHVKRLRRALVQDVAVYH